MPPNHAALLLLTDGRLPAGGYAHSGGLEPAVTAGRVADIESLESFLTGRIETTGRIAASYAAAACQRVTLGNLSELAELEVELDARVPSPELRNVSRNLGRQLRRAADNIWPHPYFEALGDAPHHPIVMGTAAAILGLEPHDAALATLHETNAGAAAAAAKLMRVDPFDVHAVLARAAARVDRIAADAAATARHRAADLPAPGSPLADIAAEHHRNRDVRLFAS